MPDRPRDRLGRPLPAGLPAGDAAEDVAPAVPNDAGATDERAWTLATAYLADGLPFHAHEAFEARWRAVDGPARQAWRALAQWGAALTHEARGNPVGARALGLRALEGLDSAPVVPDCVDVEAVRSSCRRLAGSAS